MAKFFKFFWRLLFVAFAAACATAAIILWLPLAASAQHDEPMATPIPVYRACSDPDITLAIVENNDLRNRLFMRTGKCAYDPQGLVRATVHAIYAEAIWAGDGLDTVMVVIEMRDANNMPAWAWMWKETLKRHWPWMQKETLKRHWLEINLNSDKI